jgi:hypothetical protein
LSSLKKINLMKIQGKIINSLIATTAEAPELECGVDLGKAETPIQPQLPNSYLETCETKFFIAPIPKLSRPVSPVPNFFELSRPENLSGQVPIVPRDGIFRDSGLSRMTLLIGKQEFRRTDFGNRLLAAEGEGGEDRCG